MSLDLEKFNADWLRAWSDKDVPRLVNFYTEDAVYKDPQTAAGIKGHAALTAYLTGLFGATPPMTYTPDEIWPTPNGYCGRWYCAMQGGGRMRGFDLVVLRGDKIALNEVYVHQL
ncbi:MAG: nuclear transport factor 2 family protein [Rhizomicrobium sp.]